MGHALRGVKLGCEIVVWDLGGGMTAESRKSRHNIPGSVNPKRSSDAQEMPALVVREDEKHLRCKDR